MKSIDQRVQHLLSQMTLEEKLAQLGAYWFYELQTGGRLDDDKIAARLKHGIGQITRVAGASTLDPVSAAKTANTLQRFLIERTRLGIPAILHEECCAGAMVLGGTAFPQMLGLASTFQPDLAAAMTAAIREQLLAIGARQALAPVLDVVRDPRWGRVEETFGEDPLLASHFGVAFIKGLQTDDLRQGVIATAKHFIAHSLSQGGLNCAPVQIGMQTIYDVYLAPFQAAIRYAKVASIMNAYPELDGEVVGASRRILTDLLRGKLGFDGLIVSDYEAVIMLHTFHKIADNLVIAAQQALNAGIEVELPTIVCYGDPLKEALERGEVNLECVDAAVARHLTKKYELGLFENPYVDEERVLEVFDTPTQRQLAREIARKSMVLLKNDGLLPLSKDIRRLAVIGPNAHAARNQLADYSYTAMRQMYQLKQIEDSNFLNLDESTLAPHNVKITTVLEGITAAVSADTQVLYAPGCDTIEGDEAGIAAAVEAASQADAVVLVLGDKSGLTPECTTGETRDSHDLLLPSIQQTLIRAILNTGKPLAAVLITGRPYAITGLAEGANAIVQAWLPGEEGGAAVADVLFGDVNPGGKLPITFPRSVGQVPVFYNSKPAGTRSHWYGDYVFETTEPLYPFGHGLSYTTFEYSDLTINPPEVQSGQHVDISFKVKNTGAVAGDEVVQLYTYDEYASVPRPVKELKGYCRLTLRPGESRAVTFHLPAAQVAFYNHDLQLVLESGKIQVMIGSSSQDIRLCGSFEVLAPGRVVIDEPVFVCPVTIEPIEEPA